MKSEIKERIETVRRGEVPAGYRKTRAMVYPDAWGEPYSLNSSLCENKKRNENLHFGKNDVLSVSGEHGIVNQVALMGRSYAGESVAPYHVVETGNLVYTKSPLKENPYGIIKLNKGPAGIVSTLYAVYCCANPVSAQYIENYFDIDSYLNNYLKPLVKRGAKNDMKVNNSDVLTGIIPFPPLNEQKRINEIISVFDSLIDLKKQLVEEKRRQKVGLMQKLLDPNSGVRLSGFEGKWTTATMADLFAFGSSLSKSRAELGSEGSCYLHYGDIHSNNKYLISTKDDSADIPRYKEENIKPTVLLADGDVVFVDASEDYAGVSRYVVVSNPDNVPFISGLHTIPAHSKGNDLAISFKRYCFQSYMFRKQMAYYANGMKVYGVSKGDLERVVIKYPTIKEQIAIADILSTADQEIDLLEQELAAWQQEKKALMQLLLTGLVRV